MSHKTAEKLSKIRGRRSYSPIDIPINNPMVIDNINDTIFLFSRTLLACL